MSKLRKLTRTWLRWAAEMEDKHGQPVAAGLAADMGFVEQERVMKLSERILKGPHNTLADVGSYVISDRQMKQWADEVAALEARLSKMEEKYLNAVKDNAEVARINADYLVELVDLRKLNDASIELYCGVISKTAWRVAVRNSPKGKELIALASQEEA